MHLTAVFAVALAALASANPVNITSRDNEPKFPGLPAGMDKKNVVPLALCKEDKFVGCEWHWFKNKQCTNLPPHLKNQINSVKQKMGFTDKKSEWWCDFYPNSECKGPNKYAFMIQFRGDPKKTAEPSLGWMTNNMESVRCGIERVWKVAPVNGGYGA